VAWVPAFEPEWKRKQMTQMTISVSEEGQSFREIVPGGVRGETSGEGYFGGAGPKNTNVLK